MDFITLDLAAILILALAGLVAGTVNAVAGGGTFFTFSALVFVGIPPVAANATSAVALTPSNLSSVAAYLPEIRVHWRRYAALGIASAIGGYLGAQLLLATPAKAFIALVPWFLGFATILFAVSPLLRQVIDRFSQGPGTPGRRMAGLVMQLIVSVYGGYFGAGMGIIMLAALSVAEGDDYHFINAAKNICASLIQIFALISFLSSGIVQWPAGLVAGVGSVIGGYYGVALARRVPPAVMRWFVVGVGALLTLRFALA